LKKKYNQDGMGLMSTASTYTLKLKEEPKRRKRSVQTGEGQIVKKPKQTKARPTPSRRSAPKEKSTKQGSRVKSKKN